MKLIDYSNINWEDIEGMSDLELVIACGLPEECMPVWNYEAPSTLNAWQACECQKRYFIVIPDMVMPFMG